MSLEVPRSTSHSWRTRKMPEVVSCRSFSLTEHELQRELGRLERRVAVLSAVVVLLLALVRAFDLRERLPRLSSGRAKQQLLRGVTRARKTLPLTAALRVLGMPGPRYHAWLRAELRCELDDRPSCPKTSPARITTAELMTIKDMVLSPLYRHMPIATLARYAERLGAICLSPNTWRRLVRERGWTRPRLRLYPPKPKLGVRALAPNAIWHIDVTVLRLLDGSRVYLSAVIDNFSRRILAWGLTDKLSPLLTCRVLADAARHLPAPPRDTTLVSDSGSENIAAAVTEALHTELLAHILAQVDVTYSNSMIEAFWRSLKHQWLYLNSLDTIASVRRLVAFFVEQHNMVMPHAAFDGQTPDEIFRGTGAHVPAMLAAARITARNQRLEHNRAQRCGACASSVPATSPPLAHHAPPR